MTQELLPLPKVDFYIWDPHLYWTAESPVLPFDQLFPNIKLCQDPDELSARCESATVESYRKIVWLSYEQIDSAMDLSWADLVVTYTDCAMQSRWPVVYGQLCEKLGTEKIRCIFSGRWQDTMPPAEIMYCNSQPRFGMTVQANVFQDINEVNTPFRKYMFDAMMGPVNTSRLHLLYRILEANEMSATLAEMEPTTDEYDWDQIYMLDPVGYLRNGQIKKYSSSALESIEKPLSYVNAPAQWLQVPWHIYQCSWYSIVCEDSDTGNNLNFLTEKVAKCLFAKRIFIMFNSAGLLKNLRKLGFRTFHGDIINESYDDEPNDQKRFTMAWHEIRKLYHTDARHIYPEFREVLEHNHQLIQSWTIDEFNNIKNFLHRSLL
jgi:hypothetical protein